MAKAKNDWTPAKRAAFAKKMAAARAAKAAGKKPAKRASNPPSTALAVRRPSAAAAAKKPAKPAKARGRARNPVVASPRKTKGKELILIVLKGIATGAATVGALALGQRFSPSQTIDRVLSFGIPAAVALAGYVMDDLAVFLGGCAALGIAATGVVMELIAASRAEDAAAAAALAGVAAGAAQNPPYTEDDKRVLLSLAQRAPMGAPAPNAFAFG